MQAPEAFQLVRNYAASVESVCRLDRVMGKHQEVGRTEAELRVLITLANEGDIFAVFV